MTENDISRQLSKKLIIILIICVYFTNQIKVSVSSYQSDTSTNSATIHADSLNPSDSSNISAVSNKYGTAISNASMSANVAPGSVANGSSNVISRTSPNGSETLTYTTGTISSGPAAGSSFTSGSSYTSSSSITNFNSNGLISGITSPTANLNYINTLLTPGTPFATINQPTHHQTNSTFSPNPIILPNDLSLNLTNIINNTTDNDSFNLTNVGQFNVKTYNLHYSSLNFTATEIAVGQSGALYAISKDNHLYSYNMLSNNFTITGNDLSFMVYRVSVANDGTPYVVSNYGNTYYLAYNNSWIMLPGCANDIAIGKNDEIYKIGCQKGDDGYLVYRLLCNDISRTILSGNSQHCSWINLGSGGVKIKVLKDGSPVVVTKSGAIIYYDGTTWFSLLGLYAIDLSVSNDGLVFIVQVDNSMIILNYFLQIPTIYKLNGLGKGITAGPLSQSFYIGLDNNVYTSAIPLN